MTSVIDDKHKSGLTDRLPRALSLCLLAVAAVVSATGCGTQADRDEARAATERLYQAVHRGDGTTACAQLSADLRSQLVKDESVSTCAKAVLKLSLHGDRARQVRVYATSAEVVMGGGETSFLGATAQGWRIEAVGCHPAGHGRPDECEEQA